ncbi:hypothetical protein ACJMK2_028458 [Sinanodonta woodiana]|uniref:RING-type domain-containing protein n=1 Tax=Sinanodonta woodiana TaxID=1069815 RepID=A0ABD3X948_SINWO
MNGLSVKSPLSPTSEFSREMMELYTAEFGGRKMMKLPDPEFHREVAVGKAPDTFPCGHVLCHGCIRKHLKPSRDTALTCPICGQEASRIHTADPSASLGFSTDDVDTISLLSNFDDIVQRFNGIDYNLRKLKEESVKSKSMAMTYSNCECHMCEESHGTLHVVQEWNRLQVYHHRPAITNPYLYRLHQGHVVTTFYSEVNSSSICVPCTYQELRQSGNKYPSLQCLKDNDGFENPQSVLSQVGKIIANKGAPLECLRGKNVMDIDHTIRVRERADEFNFKETASDIKRMVKQQEQIMMKVASYKIQDKGGLYHIKESSSVEQNKGETVIW